MCVCVHVCACACVRIKSLDQKRLCQRVHSPIALYDKTQRNRQTHTHMYTHKHTQTHSPPRHNTLSHSPLQQTRTATHSLKVVYDTQHSHIPLRDTAFCVGVFVHLFVVVCMCASATTSVSCVRESCVCGFVNLYVWMCVCVYVCMCVVRLYVCVCAELT